MSILDSQKLLDIGNTMDAIHKDFKVTGQTTSLEERRKSAISSGLLMTDLLLSGGIYPGGWYTFFGPEQSAKSTHMMAIMGAVSSNIPIIIAYDAEGSMTPDYIASMHPSIDIKELFGVPDPEKEGQFIIQPRVWYYPENSLELFYKMVGRLLRQLPDKFCYKSTWYLSFDRTKENISRFNQKNVKAEGYKLNKKLSEKYGKIVVEDPSGPAMQALILCDSFPALVTDSDDDDDGDNSLAVNARAHSKHAPKIAGRLKRKHSTLLGVNQLRKAPMVRYGSPDYEPGGEALKFYSQVRFKQTPRAIPHGTGQLEEEDSINGGTDTYRYIHMRTIKNKFGVPFLDSFYRLWVSDDKGQGRGFDPVYDTFQYLKATGQLTGNFRKLEVKIDKELKFTCDWDTFKKLILCKGDDLKKICKKLKLKKNPKLRERCFKQIKEEDGLRRYFDVMNKVEAEDEE